MADDRSIDVLLCTFRRPGVRDTLHSVDAQVVPDGFRLRVVVTDNDDTTSAEEVVTTTAAEMRTPVLYRHAPARNISIARNAGLEAASVHGADFVAFLDDDEIAAEDWLAELLRAAASSGADAIFGPSLAEYGPETPEWIRRYDYHSNWPERRGSVVETGYTCNALLRWRGTPWQNERFDLARGVVGGEDTEFFLRLHRGGARFEICETAVVREEVLQTRLSFAWILRRKYRSGQSYAAVAVGAAERATLGLSAAAKLLVCTAGTVAWGWSRDRRNYWILRGALHAGVVSRCLSLGLKSGISADK